MDDVKRHVSTRGPTLVPGARPELASTLQRPHSGGIRALKGCPSKDLSLSSSARVAIAGGFGIVFTCS